MSQYTAWSVIYNEQPSAAKWNIIGTNMDYFNNALPPVGSVVYYWGDSASVPGYYLLANGPTVSDAESPINGLTLPNLISRFIRGTTGNVRTTPQTGGADTVNLSHSHTVANHQHEIFYTGSNQGDWFAYNGAQILAGDTTSAGTGRANSNTGTGYPAASTAYYSSLSAPGTDSQLSSTTSVVPAYTGLIPIIRFK